MTDVGLRSPPGCTYSNLNEEMEVKLVDNQPLCLEGPLPATVSCALPFDVRRARYPLIAFRLFPGSVFKFQLGSSLCQIKACSY